MLTVHFGPNVALGAELWKLAGRLIWDIISGHLVGLCSTASMDSSLAALPRLIYIPRLSNLLFLKPKNSPEYV